MENGKLRLDRAGSSGLEFRALVFALWVAGLPGGGQNELIGLPVWAGASIYRDSVDSGGGGLEVRGLWQRIGRESGPYKKILVRCDSILPGLMDAWVLLGCLG